MESNTTPAPSQPLKPPFDLEQIRRQSAWRSALMSGIFCVILLGLLTVNYFQGRAVDPINSPALAALKANVTLKPFDDQLKAQARALDLELRTRHDRHLALTRFGGWLLLGGGLVFLAALQTATHRKKLPRPEKKLPDAQREELAARHNRWAVTGLGVLLVSAAYVVSSQSNGDLEQQARKLNLSAAAATNAVKGADTILAKVEVASPDPTPMTPYPTAEELKNNWPRFRGPGGSGIALGTNVPTQWNTNGENILWKSPIPLKGPNSPVIWGKRLFFIGATSAKREFYCYDTDTGKLVWQKTLDPVSGTHPEPPTVMEDSGGFAPSTAYTDGRRVYGIFANGDLAAVDFQGKVVWAINLGKPENSYGHASSLEMHQGHLLVQFDQGSGKDGKSKLLAFDSQTGTKVWETQPRPVPNSWASPLVINPAAQDQVITCGNPWVISYNATNGSELWRAKVLYGEVTPSPIFAGGLVFTVMEGEKLSAIKPDGSGDVTKTHVVWGAEDGLPDIASPLSDGQRIYLVNGGGMLTCYAIQDGKKLYEKELELNIQSSPSLVGDRIYLFTDKGLAVIVQAGPEYKEIGRSELGEIILSSPAFQNDRMFIRGTTTLFCIGKKS